MDSKERVETVLALGVPDRVPVLPQIGDHAGLLAGLTYDVMYRDIDQAAAAHVAAWRRYGYDVVAIQVEPSWPVAEACGAQVTYPPDKCPWITMNPIRSKDDLAGMRVPDFNATQSTRVMIEGTRRLAEEADAPVAAYMTGPLTFSLQLMPYTQMIAATLQDRPFVKEVIRAAVAIIRAYGQALQEAGASLFVLCEHDVQLFSPADFKELSLDFLPDLLDLYPHTILHLCGKVMPHLKANLKALRDLRGLSMVSVAPEVDLSELKAALAGRIGVAGNVDHLKLLPLGTSAEVDEAAGRAIAAAKSGGGFMLAPGCEITADTPPKNVEAFVGAAQKYGAY